jgi:catechol 2,3-dioxygenase-like lactoylglutathione lyase family enzyme
MRFGYTIVYVADVAASVAFYARAFGLEPRLVHDSGEYAELETGATALAFASHGLAARNVPNLAPGSGNSFEVCLVTEDVGTGFSRAVEAGAEPVSEPVTKPWGQEVAYVRDPDGVLVELASPA